MRKVLAVLIAVSLLGVTPANAATVKAELSAISSKLQQRLMA